MTTRWSTIEYLKRASTTTCTAKSVVTTFGSTCPIDMVGICTHAINPQQYKQHMLSTTGYVV